MAAVPVARQVETGPAGIVQGELRASRPDTPAGAFGGQVGQALGGLGDALGTAGAVGLRYAAQQQALTNETDATRIVTEFDRKAMEMSVGFTSLQGQEAVQGFQGYRQGLTALEQNTLNSTDNQAVRRMLEQRLASRTTQLIGSGMTHNAQQVRSASVSASQGAASLALNEGVTFRDDPAVQQNALSRGLGEVTKAGEVQGWAPEMIEAKRAEYAGTFWQGVVGSVVDTDPLRAQRIFEANRGTMDAATALRIENQLEGPVRTRRATDIVAAVTGAGTGAPGENLNADQVRDRVFRAENPAGDARRNAAGSSASGPGQITDGTWATFAGKLGLRPDQRNDLEAHKQIWAAYQQDAQQTIGRALNPGEQYNAWVLGPAGLKAFIMAGPDADARQVYTSVVGEGTAAKAFSQNGRLMRDGMTTGQVMEAIAQRVGATTRGGGGTAFTGEQRDRGVMLEAALARAGDDPQLRASVISQFGQQMNVLDATQAQERARMTQRVQDTGKALEVGNTNVTIPEADIRRLFQPEQAQQFIETLQTQRVAGQIFASVNLATPQQVADMRADLANGTGPLTDTLRRHRGTVIGPDGKPAETDAAGDVTARETMLKLFEARVSARQTAMLADPATFVTNDPVVRAAADAYGRDPSTISDYMNTTLAAQTRLGVPAADQRIFSIATSQRVAKDLMSGDPATSNPAAKLQQMAAQYGPAWPRVMQDLQRDGKLPPEYSVMAGMPSTIGQADMQRTLAAIATAGSADNAFASLGPDKRKDVREEVRTAMEPFAMSAMSSGGLGAANVVSTMHSATENLAMFYTLQGVPPAEAARRAADRTMNDRYDFDGTMRVPKGRLPEVERATDQVVAGLTAERLMRPPGGDPALTEAQHRDIALRAARRGDWVPNERGDGLVLMTQLVNGGRAPVRLADGTPVGVTFDNLPTPAAAAPGLSFSDTWLRRTPAATAPAPAAGPTQGPTAPAAVAPVGNTPPRRTGRWVRPDAGATP